jgi:hypothetical protein
MRHSFAAIVWILVLPSVCAAQENLYSSWPNFPQSTSFFPLVIWDENPPRSLGSGAPHSTDAAGIAGTKMNIQVQIDNGGGANYPTSYGTDTGGMFQALVNHRRLVSPQLCLVSPQLCNEGGNDNDDVRMLTLGNRS